MAASQAGTAGGTGIWRGTGAAAGRHCLSASLESDARGIAASLERHKLLVVLLLTLLYLVGAALRANGKELWYDEIITFVAASAPDAAGTWKTAQAIDASPPLPHLMMHFARVWFGSGQLALRIPFLVCFWIFCLCLFRFTLCRLGFFYALAAMLMPVVTDVYTFSVEARAYLPELGFCGLALIAWQAAAEGRRRIFNVALLAASLAAAILCHYYAVLIFLPLAAGEAFRNYRGRRVDWLIWGALAAGATPLVWRAASIAGAVKDLTHTWTPPHPAQVMEFWQTRLTPAATFLVLFLALLALMLLSKTEEPAEPPEQSALAPHEIVAGLVFLAIPVIAVAGSMLVTHIFTERYALPGFTGFAILAPAVLSRLTGGRSIPAFFLVNVLVLAMLLAAVANPRPTNPFSREPILSAALEEGPVVVDDGHLFLQMWYYAPAELRARMVFLVDYQAAVRHMGFDTIDGGIFVLRPYADVNAVQYRDFHPPGGEFLVYHNALRPSWVVPKAMEDGAAVDVLRVNTERQLLRIRLPGAR
jgi:hypothetical protein